MAYCNYCGSQIPSNSVYCPKCGNKIQGDAGFGAKGNDRASFGPGQYRVPIRERSVVLCVILSFVTCGIYGIVWYFSMINDLHTASPAADDKTPGMVLLLSIVTCGIYGFVWMYKAGEKVDRIRALNGEAPSSSPALYLVLSLVGFSIVACCIIQSELNKVAQISA